MVTLDIINIGNEIIQYPMDTIIESTSSPTSPFICPFQSSLFSSEDDNISGIPAMSVDPPSTSTENNGLDS